MLIVALPAVEVLWNSVPPPTALTAVPAWLLTVALPAVEVPKNFVVPPNAPFTVPPLLLSVALAAVEVPKNCVVPLVTLLTVAPLLENAVRAPAVAPLVKVMVPNWLAPFTAVTKFCVMPELFAIPVPLSVSVSVGLAVIVNALAPALNVIPLTCVPAESESAVVPDVANVAVSAAPFGTEPPTQFVPAFQRLLPGAAFHVSLPAKASPEWRSASSATPRMGRREWMPRVSGRGFPERPAAARPRLNCFRCAVMTHA